MHRVVARPRRDAVARLYAELNEQLIARGLPVRYRQGALQYQACPRCGEALRPQWRQADATYRVWWTCDGCRWCAWGHEMHAEIQRRYGIEVG